MARAKADGYTLLLGTSAGRVVTPLMQKTAYDGVRDFAFCSVVAVQPIMLAVNPARRHQDGDGPDHTRPGGAPRKLSYGSAGVGGATHLGAELFQQAAHIKLNRVPYPGASPAVNDAVGGQLDMVMLNLSASLAFTRQGRLVPLAYASDKLIAAAAPGSDHGRGRRARRASGYLVQPGGAGGHAGRDRAAPERCRSRREPGSGVTVVVMRNKPLELMALAPDQAQAYVEKDRAEMQALLDRLGLIGK